MFIYYFGCAAFIMKLSSSFNLELNPLLRTGSHMLAKDFWNFQGVGGSSPLQSPMRFKMERCILYTKIWPIFLWLQVRIS